ncbi:PLD nuclease N-terminal domain-containing protein [Verrucomicrobiota bacterium]
MKRQLWIIMVLAGSLVVSQAFGAKPKTREHDRPNKPAEGIALRMEMRQKQMALQAQEMQLRQKELDIEEREAEMEFTEKVRKIKLEKNRLDLEKIRRSIQNPPKHGNYHKNKKQGRDCHGKKCTFLILCAIVNVMLAIWVYQDIRRKNAGSGIWIVLTLLMGFFGALLYAMVRLGDKQS